MKRSGRLSTNTLLFAGIVLLVLIFVVILSAQGGPATSAAKFLHALAKADAQTLAELSIIGSDDYETRLKKWEDTLERTEYYLWSYQIMNTVETSDTTAAVRVEVIRNPTSNTPVVEKFELSMEKRDNQWKVIVPAISRAMYPSLPE